MAGPRLGDVYVVANYTKTEFGTHAAVEYVTRAGDSLPQSDYMEVSDINSFHTSYADF